jgi:hypothetical protein
VPNTVEFSYSARGMCNALKNITTDIENKATEFRNMHSELSRKNKYFRFNSDRGTGEIPIDAISKIGKIQSIVFGYLGRHELGRNIIVYAEIVGNKLKQRM